MNNFRRPMTFRMWSKHYASDAEGVAYVQFAAACIAVGALPGLVFGRWGGAVLTFIALSIYLLPIWRRRKR